MRWRISKHLMPVYPGKAEIVRSLRTKDRAEALRLSRAIFAELDNEFAAAEQAMVERAQPMPADG